MRTATRDQVIARAREWVGVPFHHQGRNRHGVDCVGLLINVYGSLGLTEYDFGGYGRVPDGRTILREAENILEEVPVWSRKPGDIFVMRYGKQPQHLGIISPHGVIHSRPPHGVVEVVLHDSWLRRFVACYHVPGVV